MALAPLCGANPIAVTPEGPENVFLDQSFSELRTYAIVCTPRSGSTYLAEMLESLGLGQPKEHLRRKDLRDLFRVLEATDNPFELLATFIRARERNSVFGTKVISHSLFSLLSGVALPKDFVSFVRSQFRVIYLVRKDKTGQALSDFLAHRSGVWHARTRTALDSARNAHRCVKYAFDDILDRRNRLIAEEVLLADQVMRTTHRVIFYEDLVVNCDVAMAAIVEFLGGSYSQSPSSIVLRHDPVVAASFRQLFVVDYRSRFQTDPMDFLPPGLSATEGGLAKLMQ